jgi:hypothetical protein
MFNTTKLAVAAVMIAGATISATAAAKMRPANDQASGYDVIPGYDSQGRTVSIPNPDRRGR